MAPPTAVVNVRRVIHAADIGVFLSLPDRADRDADFVAYPGESNDDVARHKTIAAGSCVVRTSLQPRLPPPPESPIRSSRRYSSYIRFHDRIYDELCAVKHGPSCKVRPGTGCLRARRACRSRSGREVRGNGERGLRGRCHRGQTLARCPNFGPRGILSKAIVSVRPLAPPWLCRHHPRNPCNLRQEQCTRPASVAGRRDHPETGARFRLTLLAGGTCCGVRPINLAQYIVNTRYYDRILASRRGEDATFTTTY